jgi:hypothetical protein
MTTGSIQWILLLLPLTAPLLSGCGSGSANNHIKQTSHVRAIAALYFTANSVLGKNPSNEQEFKNVLSQRKMDLGVLGVSSVDELFVSDRDDQPLVIIYGPQPKGAAQGVIVYEQIGKDGVKLVGTSNGQVIEADAAQFAKLVPSPQQ